MEGKYWDTEAAIITVPKDTYSEYQLSACTKNEKTYINIREWYWTSQNSTKQPGKQGLCFPITNNGDVCSCLIAAMQEARKYFEKEGLL